MRLSLKVVATFFFYALIAVVVIGSSFISDPVVGVITYPAIILASLAFIMLLKLRVRPGRFAEGAAAALVSMGLVLGVLVLSGSVVIGPVANNYLDILLMGVVLQLLVSFGEELSFRASIFQGLRDELGLWPGAVLSAAAFAVLHVPSMDFLGIGAASDLIALGTIFFAGVALALLYAYGGILNAIAFHFVWNFIEYNLFQLGPLEGAISVLKPGPVILTGGAFGPEASVATLVVTALLALALWLYYSRRAKKDKENIQA